VIVVVLGFVFLVHPFGAFSTTGSPAASGTTQATASASAVASPTK